MAKKQRPLQVFKTHMFFADHDHGHAYLIDTIFLQGKWWLVASWLQSHATGERVPERLILLDGLPFGEVENQQHYCFFLERLIPKRVFDGEVLPGYVVATYQALADSPAPRPGRAH